MLLCCKNSRVEWVMVCLLLLRTCWNRTSEVQQNDGGWRAFFGERQKLLAALQARCFVCTHHCEFWFRLGIKVKYCCGILRVNHGSMCYRFNLSSQFHLSMHIWHISGMTLQMEPTFRGRFLPKSGRDLMELLCPILWLEQGVLRENRSSGWAVKC